MRFPTVKLLDLDLAELEADPNIFAAIILMHRDAQDTTVQPEARMHRKFTRWRQVLRRGYNPVQIRLLVQMLERLLRLPAVLRAPTVAQLRAIEQEETGMDTFVTSIEEVGIERGLLEGRRTLVLRQLTTQVGPLAADTLAAIERLSATDLEVLAIALLRFTTPADLAAWLTRVDDIDPA